eukprot:TRINITY_DN15557_c1_g1_i1.p1 TRINITY_DN15557_c1_g1~~TRINITY_DN15557_c1_g1_i1.p1  ORF type:complete len:538 (+),score=72.32 TRINITY_DN15557_c1_g1_i1:48-1661(+)
MACLGLSGPNPTVLAAVEKAGGRCTGAEISANVPGLSLAAAEDELKALLARGGGRFEVCEDSSSHGGERVFYSFPADLRARVAQSQRKAACLDALDRVMPICAFAIRFSLGVFIFVSLAIIALVAVVVAVAALAALASSGGDSRHQRHLEFGGWSMDRMHAKLNRMIAMWNHAMCIYMCFGGGNPFFIPPILDPYYYAFTYGAWGNQSNWRRPRFGQGGFYRRRDWLQPWFHHEAPAASIGSSTSGSLPARLVDGHIRRDVPASSSAEGTNIVEAVFSFLFGDGPPQPGPLEHWRLLAALMRQSNGVVTGEMLTPYLAQPPPSPAAGLDVEDWTAWSQTCDASIIPVVEHFRGRPEATEDGSGLVYTFHELLGGAAARRLGVEEQPSEPVPRCLVEGEWQFSKRSSWELRCTLALGLLNLLGALWLMLATSPRGSVVRFLGRGVGLLLGLLTRWALLPYAVMFLLLPCLRAAWVFWSNRGVHARNEIREMHASRLEAAQQDGGAMNCHAVRAKLHHADRLRRTAKLKPSGPAASHAV